MIQGYGLSHTLMEICSHQGDLQSPCIASASALCPGAWEMSWVPVPVESAEILFGLGLTCTLVNFKYA